MLRNRFSDPWEEGSPEALDNGQPVIPASSSLIPEIAAQDREIADEIAEESGIVAVFVPEIADEVTEEELNAILRPAA